MASQSSDRRPNGRAGLLGASRGRAAAGSGAGALPDAGDRRSARWFCRRADAAQSRQTLCQFAREPAEGNPRRIVFHAMVAAFNEDDFEADPNNFITYFLHEDLSVKVACVRMPAPGIVETRFWAKLREFEAIRRVYSDARNMNIIVTSGGRWGDEHSTLATYLKQIGGSDDQVLEQQGAIGDLLWQPLSKDGPIDIGEDRFQFRANTLVELGQLPQFIQEGGRVLLVLGSCSECHTPKGELLHVILQGQPRLVTDVVVDTPTVHDLFRNPPLSAPQQG